MAVGEFCPISLRNHDVKVMVDFASAIGILIKGTLIARIRTATIAVAVVLFLAIFIFLSFSFTFIFVGYGGVCNQ